MGFDGWPLWLSVAVFAASAVGIGISGTRLVALADRLADRTRLGEALTGAIFLGGVTSLAGVATSVTAAVDGDANLSVSNALGGIAAQTMFLAIADLFHREANLEHAAASLGNVLQSALLICLLGVILLAMFGPRLEFMGIHPATPALLGGYIFGVVLIHRSRDRPMWRPRSTPETRPDVPEPGAHRENLSRLIGWFIVNAAVITVCGVLVARTGGHIAGSTGISVTLFGALFTAVATSLPELMTTVAAVRRGALVLAVGDIIGGNAFDTLFLAVSDVAYRSGSIYHAIGRGEMFLASLGVLMTGVLTLGLVQREKKGFANIGFESILILALGTGGYITLAFIR